MSTSRLDKDFSKMYVNDPDRGRNSPYSSQQPVPQAYKNGLPGYGGQPQTMGAGGDSRQQPKPYQAYSDTYDHLPQSPSPPPPPYTTLDHAAANPAAPQRTVNIEEDLPPYFEPWNELGLNMKEYVPLGEFRNAVDLMPLLDHTRLEGYKQHRLAKVLLSFITAGYVWEEGDQGICKVLPRQVAVPLYHVSRHLGEQPILTHYNFALANYRLIDKTQPFNADNLAELCCFPHPATRWFIAVTCCFEKAAAPGVKACVDAIHAAQTGDVASLTDALDRMCDAIRAVQTAISRMHEKLSASDFFNNVRPFLSGWGGEGNPAPEGIIYEGVSDSHIQCRGGSAGQSSALQCFDTTLGITHSADKEAFMREMRQYMPAPHRSFIQAVQKHSRVRQTVEKLDDEDLSGAYNACVTSLHDLRSYHIRIVTKYIVCPSKSESREKAYDSLATKGTGGSSLMPFLKDIRSTTSKAIIHKV